MSESVETKTENEYLIIFNKPYEFEGKTYKELDMSGLENLRAKDMIDANNFLNRTGAYSITPELQMQYAMVIASKATGQPIEFFYNLPPKDALKVKGKVTSFFYGED